MPKITCAIAPSAAGRIRHLPGLGVKPLASANWRASAGSAFLIASQFALWANVMGMALALGAVSNTGGMWSRALGRGAMGYVHAFGRPRKRPINQTLGLTVYCWPHSV